MKTLRQIISEVDKAGIAIGHFNFSDLVGLKAIVYASSELDLPVVVSVSEGERKFVGTKEAVALVRSLQKESSAPIFLSADHVSSFDSAKEAIDAGFDLVVFDRSELSIDDNIAETKKCVEYARSVNSEILVEGELGYIGKSSKMLDEIPEGALGDSLTNPEDVARFVAETGVDLFSPAVGNIHGMLKNAPNPRLDIERIRAVRKAAGVPLVLHGGSGISDEDFTAAIGAGVAIIHINTELRLAYRQALEKVLSEKPYEFAPYKYLAEAATAVEEVTLKRLRLFAGLGF